MMKNTSKLTRVSVSEAKRVVIKVGTRVLTKDSGHLVLSRLFHVVEALVDLQAADREVLLVSSGAVGLGREALGFSETPTDVSERQACAAVGQSRLMELYQAGFGRLGLRAAQVLLTQEDFDDRARYLTLRGALTTLLRLKVIPVINENDVVSTTELALLERGEGRVFGDNDRLSALVASKLHADLLVLLTDVHGVYDRDPKLHSDAAPILQVDNPEALRDGLVGGETSGAGRGGMRTKIEAATIAARSGCHVVIASGEDPTVLPRVLAGEDVGTWFPAKRRMSARERWIAFAAHPRGELHLDDGAIRALTDRGGSLLAAGVTRVEGVFIRGDVVELVNSSGLPVGRGIIRVDAATVRTLLDPQERTEASRPLIRRETLVLEVP